MTSIYQQREKAFSNVSAYALNCRTTEGQTMRPQDIKTASDLSILTEEHAPHFFDRSAMRFFGDTMSNFGVRHWLTADGRHLVELYRRNPVKHGLQESHYWEPAPSERGNYLVMRKAPGVDASTLSQCIPPRERALVLGSLYSNQANTAKGVAS